MNKLGVYNYNLISQGVKCEGSFDPHLIYYYFEESLLISEASDIWQFLAWVHTNGKSFGHGNYEEVFAEWEAEKRAATWYKNHQEHVDGLVAEVDNAYAPSAEDFSSPQLWKPAHWKWFIVNRSL